jgi:hypothetical protein
MQRFSMTCPIRRLRNFVYGQILNGLNFASFFGTMMAMQAMFRISEAARREYAEFAAARSE